MYKDKLQKIIDKSSPRYWYSIIARNNDNSELYEYILNSTSFLSVDAKLNQRIYHVINNLDIIPSCLVCGKSVKFRNYSYGYNNYCSPRCSSSHHETREKTEKTCMDRYGHKTNLLSDKTQQKIRTTNIERYGVDNPLKNKEIQTKRLKTLEEKHGVTNPIYVNEAKEKSVRTNLERYGTEYGLQSSEIKEKSKNTMKERYGAEYTLQSLPLREKYNDTMMSRYGVNTPILNDDIKKKIHDTTMKKYGVTNPKYLNYSEETLKVLTNQEMFTEQYFDSGPFSICEKFNVDMQIVRLYCKKYNISHELNLYNTEAQIQTILDKFNTKYIRNDRKTISPYELDFYLPELNMAIEICGLYWHSEIKNKNTKYHQMKWQMCKNKNIRLITIFEDELNNHNIIDMRLKYLTQNQSNRIHARKCHIKEISTDIARNFCNTYHIQGYVNSKIKLGAYYNNNLVSVMTFGALRAALGNKNKENSYELLRFCSANYVIPGISSKLFKYFKNIYNPDYVLSYCDLRWGTGNVYEKIGFSLDHYSSPNYWYVENYKKRYHRYNFRKHVLVEQGFDKNLTEWQIMQQRGYDRIWDCGNSVWVWQK